MTVGYELRRGGAALLFLLAASAASAQQRDEEDLQEVPLPLPQGVNGTVRPGPAPRPERIDRIRDVFAAVRACWQPPRAGGFTGQELTVRLSFKSSGEVLGKPRITYYKAGGQEDDREAFTDSVRSAFERCARLPFSPSLGGAVAGRPFTFRFIDARAL